MLYVQQSLAPNERIIHIGHFHWFYTVAALLNIVWGVMMCFIVLWAATYVYQNFLGLPADIGWWATVSAIHPGIKIVAFLMIIFGLLKFAQMMIVKVTTEIAVTTTRLVYKRGLVARAVGEMSIDRIEGVNFMQGILGRMFNFGRVVVRGMGVGELVTPPLANPVIFRKAIEKARTV